MENEQKIWEDVGPRLRAIRLALGRTLEWAASGVGVHISHINKIELSQRGASLELLHKLSAFYGVSLGEILGLGKDLKVLGLRYIPLVSRIAAGDPMKYTNGDYPPGWTDESVPCPEDVRDPAAFALRIAGTSMIPRFREGDILIVSPHTKLKDDIAVVFRLRTGERGVKTYRQGSAGEIILVPENCEYGGAEVFECRDFCWIYSVVKSVRSEY